MSWFVVPFAKEPSAPGPAISVPAAAAERIPGNKLALIVEDNAVIQLVTTKQLVSLGLQAHTVATGKHALESIRNCDYDFILMDCQMPEMDGFQATKAIREMEAGTNDHRVIIAMTASAMAGDQEKCLAAGMDDYISKPFTIDQLRAKLVKWLTKENKAAKSRRRN